MNLDASDQALDPQFFEGRVMVEITQWDWNLYVGFSPETVPIEYRFQGGLNYSRGLEIRGRVRAPSADRGKLIRIWLSPFGPDVGFGIDGLDSIGRFYRGRSEVDLSEYQASLYLPESALSPVVSCLSSIWRYLNFWTVDDGGDESPVSAFTFSATVHPNLLEWAGPELLLGSEADSP
jgi:hypothetical protein